MESDFGNNFDVKYLLFRSAQRNFYPRFKYP